MPPSPRRRAMRTMLAAALLAAAATAQAQYPQRPVQLIVPWGAGGRTDATTRIIGTLIDKDLKQPFNVVNRTGGSGVVGHDAIARATPDGYTIGMITVEITMMHHVGLTPLTYKDYTPIGLVNADPAGVNVRVDAPYKSVKDLLAAIKSNPGKLKASGTGQGGIWHLAIAGLLKDQGIDPPALYPNLPTLKKELGTSWQIAAWRVIAAPKGIAAEAQKTLVGALKRVYDSKEYKEFMASRGFGVVWADPDGTTKFMAASDANLGAALKAVGI